MDLSKIIQSESTHLLDLLHPVTEKPIGMILELRSSQSDAVKAIERESNNKLMERQQKGKLITTETTERQAEKRAATMIKGWEITADEAMTIDGVDLTECNDKTRMSLVGLDWAYEQVIAASSDLANFTKS